MNGLVIGLDEKNVLTRVPQMRTFIFERAKIWKYPPCVKSLHFIAKAEIMRSFEWICGQVSIIYSKFALGVFL